MRSGDKERYTTLRRRSFELLARVAPLLTRADAFEVEALIDDDAFCAALELIDELAAGVGLTASIAHDRARIAAVL